MDALRALRLRALGQAAPLDAASAATAEEGEVDDMAVSAAASRNISRKRPSRAEGPDGARNVAKASINGNGGGASNAGVREQAPFTVADSEALASSRHPLHSSSHVLLPREDDDAAAAELAARDWQPQSGSTLVIDLDALSSSDDEAADDEQKQQQKRNKYRSNESPGGGTATLRHLQELLAAKQEARRARKAAKQPAPPTPIPPTDNETAAERERAREVSLMQTRVSAQEALLRQLLNDCKALQEDCEYNVRVVERDVPADMAEERRRMSEAQAVLDEGAARLESLARKGQAAATQAAELREALAQRKAQVKAMYDKVRVGMERLRALEGKSAAPALSSATGPSAGGDDAALTELLKAAKARAAGLTGAEVSAPCPPISASRLSLLQAAAESGMDAGLDTQGSVSHFGRLWLEGAHEAAGVFHALSRRLGVLAAQDGAGGSSAAAPASMSSAPVTPSLTAPYVSPLLALRSFRVSPLFAATNSAGADVSHPSLSNAVAPNALLCRFELAGTCNDTECAYLHRRDYELAPDALFADLARYSTPAQVEAARTELDVLPGQGAPTPGQWARALAALAAGAALPSLAGAPRPSTLPRRSLSETAARRAMEQTQEAEGDLDDVPRVRNRAPPPPPAESDDFVPLPQMAPDADGGGGGVPVADEHDERLHESGVALSASDKAVEELAARDPNNVAEWLRLVRPHLHAHGAHFEAAGILARALELNESSLTLWLLFLLLFLRSSHAPTPVAVAAVFESAVRRLPGSPVVWLLWVAATPDFAGKDAVGRRGIAAVAAVQARLAPERSRALSAALLQLLLAHARLLVDAGAPAQAAELLHQWADGPADSDAPPPLGLPGPHALLPRDHVNLLLVLVALDRDLRVPALEPVVFRDGHYLLLALPDGPDVALAAQLQRDEAQVIARGYSMADILPLRVNRIRACMAAGDAALATALRIELASFCPDDPDVQWLAGSASPGDDGVIDLDGNRHSSFVTAWATASAALASATPQQRARIAAAIEPAARTWQRRSASADSWLTLLGADTAGGGSGLAALLRPPTAPLSDAERCAAWLCAAAVALLSGAPAARVAALFEDAVAACASLPTTHRAPLWASRLAFETGQSLSQPHDALLERARNDLALLAQPAFMGRLALLPGLPESVCDADDVELLTPHGRHKLSNQLLATVLGSLPALARRRAVLEALRSAPDNGALALWAVHCELAERVPDDVTHSDLLQWRPLVSAAVRRSPRDVYARLTLAALDLMLGRGRDTLDWLDTAAPPPTLAALWHVALLICRRVPRLCPRVCCRWDAPFCNTLPRRFACAR